MSELADRRDPRPVLSDETVFSGAIWDVVRDVVDLGGPGAVRREYVRHPGAVAVLAVDEDDRVLLLRQYRHPVRSALWELPAGLLDVPGEDPRAAAARELAEEADLLADTLTPLVEHLTTPGGSDETLRIFQARGLRPVPVAERHERRDEESEIELRWVPLDDAVEGVLAGRLRSPSTVVGVLAADAVRRRSGGGSSG